MKLSDFDYALPPELIASHPVSERSRARLMKCDPENGNVTHHIFTELTEFLKSGDLLVLNDTKVMPSRIFGKRMSGGKVEALLVKPAGDRTWEALLRPGGRIKKNESLRFGEDSRTISVRVLDEVRANSAMRLMEFETDQPLTELFEKIGHMPLPPYINRPDVPSDREMYQTVFARHPGAVASPTAGLHFDQPLLESLKSRGVEIAFVTLHVGYGTFQSISVENLSEHRMHEEEYEVSPGAAKQINRALREKRRIIACGTTSVRTLESAVLEGAKGMLSVRPGKGVTSLFVYPPYSFRIVDGLITNFHLPKSSLLLLVAAFLQHRMRSGDGRDHLFRIYEEAIRNQYRFYSYGDAMVIL